MGDLSSPKVPFLSLVISSPFPLDSFSFFDGFIDSLASSISSSMDSSGSMGALGSLGSLGTFSFLCLSKNNGICPITNIRLF